MRSHEVRAKRAQANHRNTEQFSSIMGCLWLATRLTLLSMRRKGGGRGGTIERKKLAPCNLVRSMVERAVACGAFAAEVSGVVWGEQKYFDLQTRVLAAERQILHRVDLGRHEGDETLIAKALGLVHLPEGQPPTPELEPEPEA